MPIQIIVSLIDKVRGPASRIERGLAGIGSWADKARQKLDKMSSTGKSMAAAGLVLIGLSTTAVAAFGAVEGAAAPLETVITSTMGGVEQSMQAARSAAREWSDSHVQSATEFLNASYMMASAGLNDIQAIEGTRIALGVATATMGDSVQTANALATMYNVLGDKSASVGTEMQRLGDLLTVTQQRFQLPNMGQLVEGLKYAAPAAKQFGVSLEQTLAVVGELNSAGLTGSMAGTAYASALRTMNKASKELHFSVVRTKNGQIDLAATISKLKDKYGDLAKATPRVQDQFQKAFGDEGVRAVAVLMGVTDRLGDDMNSLATATGAVGRSQAIIESKPLALWGVLLNRVSNLAGVMGGLLWPTLERGIGILDRALVRIDSWVTANPEMARWVAQAVLASGAFLAIGGGALVALATVGKFITYIISGISALGKLAKVFRLLGVAIGFVGKALSFLFLNPMGLAILAIVALVAGGYLLIKNWDKVVAWFKKLPQTIRDAWGKITAWWKDSGKQFVATFVEGVTKAWHSGWAKIKDLFGKLRALLPFSDAKEGPLSDLTKSGRAFSSTFAGGVISGQPDLSDAASRLLDGGLRKRVEDFRVSFSGGRPAPVASARDRRGGLLSGGRPVEVHVHNYRDRMDESDVERVLVRAFNRAAAGA